MVEKVEVEVKKVKGKKSSSNQKKKKAYKSLSTMKHARQRGRQYRKKKIEEDNNRVDEELNDAKKKIEIVERKLERVIEENNRIHNIETMSIIPYAHVKMHREGDWNNTLIEKDRFQFYQTLDEANCPLALRKKIQLKLWFLLLWVLCMFTMVDMELFRRIEWYFMFISLIQMLVLHCILMYAYIKIKGAMVIEYQYERKGYLSRQQVLDNNMRRVVESIKHANLEELLYVVNRKIGVGVHPCYIGASFWHTICCVGPMDKGEDLVIDYEGLTQITCLRNLHMGNNDSTYSNMTQSMANYCYHSNYYRGHEAEIHFVQQNTVEVGVALQRHYNQLYNKPNFH